MKAVNFNKQIEDVMIKFNDVFEILSMNNRSMTCLDKENGKTVYMTRRVFNTLLHHMDKVQHVYVEKEDPRGKKIIWVGLVEVNVF